VDISGSKVSLSNFSAGGLLNPGDIFYFIKTEDNNYLSGNSANNKAYSRQGFTNFIEDKNAYAPGGTNQ
jgi:hypothetical protein